MWLIAYLVSHDDHFFVVQFSCNLVKEDLIYLDVLQGSTAFYKRRPMSKTFLGDVRTSYSRKWQVKRGSGDWFRVSHQTLILSTYCLRFEFDHTEGKG